MSRILKRVSPTFSWPLQQVWVGYLNPYHSKNCRPCEGTGYSPLGKLYFDQWYGYAPFDPVEYGAEPLRLDDPGLRAMAERNVHGEVQVKLEICRLWNYMIGQWSHHLIQADVDALLAAGRLMDFTHIPRTEEQREVVRKKMAVGGNSWLPENNGYVPSAAEVNAWSVTGFGHDSINQWVCTEARCERDGVPYACSVCSGSGRHWPSQALKKQHEGWKNYDPPAGDGYQLWEDTSEGSPITPVFETLNELCEYAAEHCSTFGSQKTTAEQWRGMLSEGHVYHQEGAMVFM